MKFKNEKGITLISLILYVISMLITVTIITIITGYFSKNIDVEAESYTYYSEYIKFESYFTEEINKEGNKLIDIHNGTGTEQSYIVFSSGNQYTYVPNNKAIYQNNVKITSGVQSCSFTEKYVNGKKVIKVEFAIKGNAENESHTRSTEYVLND